MGTASQPAPVTGQFKLLVLEFIKRYYAQYGRSPSLGDIARALKTYPQRVQRAVRRLAAEGHIVRVPGPCGISLPDSSARITEADALLRLKAAGYDVTCAEAGLAALRPLHNAVTYPCLPPVPELDHIPDIDTRDIGGGYHGQQRAGSGQPG